MTTTVANVHTGSVVAHALRGAFVVPDPEDTFAHLRKRARSTGVAQHAVLVQKEHMRRSSNVETIFYQREHDGLRGRFRAVSRRREHQKRGPPHYH